MTTSQDPSSGMVAVMESLPSAECWGLLATAEVGRLGLLVAGKPEVLPVNYALDGESVVFRTGEGTVLNEASLRVVAFEVDHVDATRHEGWSVLVQGLARPGRVGRVRPRRGGPELARRSGTTARAGSACSALHRVAGSRSSPPPVVASPWRA